MIGRREPETHFQTNYIRVVFSRRMLVALLMGFSCGLPLLLTWGILQAWMKEEGLDLTVIGMITLVQIPYTWKFVWAPVLDRFALPWLGRRRGWLLIAQLALMASIVSVAFSDPLNHFRRLILSALLVAFFSATQDIVVDAYRREDLSDAELGLGSSFYIYGYRLGMLAASGGGLILADHMAFTTVYLIMALGIIPGLVTTLLTPEPKVAAGIPESLKEAVLEPLADYFRRNGAVWILVFILLYKIGDTMAAAIATPFYLDLGFTKTQVGAVVQVFGTGATLAGAFLGGIVQLRLGIVRSLWLFGILQAISTAGFAMLARIGPSVSGLSAVIAFENLSGGMGTAAFVAFMASITNKKFTATQYALLTSLMGIPRAFVTAPSGFVAKLLGWEVFFIACTLLAIPGLLLLIKFVPWQRKVVENFVKI